MHIFNLSFNTIRILYLSNANPNSHSIILILRFKIKHHYIRLRTKNLNLNLFQGRRESDIAILMNRGLLHHLFGYNPPPLAYTPARDDVLTLRPFVFTFFHPPYNISQYLRQHIRPRIRVQSTRSTRTQFFNDAVLLPEFAVFFSLFSVVIVINITINNCSIF